MTPITVNHALGAYPVYIEPGTLRLLGELLGERLPGCPLIMIADETVSRLYDEWTSGTQPEYAARLVFPPGEGSKTRASWQRLTDQMLVAGFGRDCAIVAIGGGVTGDLAGFVAATFHRGIPYVQVPTTFLAMVDASVGGKVGLNTAQGKNLVGVFHPPALVVVDPLTLASLPEQEYCAGLAEVVKHGLIADRDYFEWIAVHEREIRARQSSVVAQLVRRSIEIKASVVAEDEREQGRRAILNAGHTVAHALEQALAYRIPHGEAVAIGLVIECRIAETLGVAGPGVTSEVSRSLERFGLPVHPPMTATPEAMLQAMRADKKNRSGAIHFALPAAIGRMHGSETTWTVPVPPETILTALSGEFLNISTQTAEASSTDS